MLHSFIYLLFTLSLILFQKWWEEKWFWVLQEMGKATGWEAKRVRKYVDFIKYLREFLNFYSLPFIYCKISNAVIVF